MTWRSLWAVAVVLQYYYAAGACRAWAPAGRRLLVSHVDNCGQRFQTHTVTPGPCHMSRVQGLNLSSSSSLTGLLADVWQRFQTPTVYTQTLSWQSWHMSRVQSLNLSSSSSPLVSESIVTILNTRWCCVNLYKRSFLSWTFSFHIYQGTI